MTLEQICINASLLIIAGSETTATALSGASYLLGTNPDALSKVTDEVRSAFSSEQEITLLSVQKLKYMLAVLDETLRMFPPVPGSAPRIVHQGGGIFCDTFLPEGVSLAHQILKTMDLSQRRADKSYHADDHRYMAMAYAPVHQTLHASRFFRSRAVAGRSSVCQR